MFPDINKVFPSNLTFTSSGLKPRVSTTEAQSCLSRLRPHLGSSSFAHCSRLIRKESLSFGGRGPSCLRFGGAPGSNGQCAEKAKSFGSGIALPMMKVVPCGYFLVVPEDTDRNRQNFAALLKVRRGLLYCCGIKLRTLSARIETTSEKLIFFVIVKVAESLVLFG